MGKVVSEFVATYGTACGGDWSAMLLSAIKNGMADTFEAMSNTKEWTFDELVRIIEGRFFKKKIVLSRESMRSENLVSILLDIGLPFSVATSYHGAIPFNVITWDFNAGEEWKDISPDDQEKIQWFSIRSEE